MHDWERKQKCQLSFYPVLYGTLTHMWSTSYFFTQSYSPEVFHVRVCSIVKV